jgi:hypothetical protein
LRADVGRNVGNGGVGKHVTLRIITAARRPPHGGREPFAPDRLA